MEDDEHDFVFSTCLSNEVRKPVECLKRKLSSQASQIMVAEWHCVSSVVLSTSSVTT